MKDTAQFRTAVKRFESKIVKAANGCWLYMGMIDRDGYGRLRPGYGKTYVGAHRYAWMLKNGPIPSGLIVLHRCDTPNCVNVDHLSLGTNRENVDDMLQKNRQLRGESWHKAHPRNGQYQRSQPIEPEA